jgi:hypothetical protein
MLLQRPLPPGVKLLRKRLVQATDRASTGSNAQKSLGHFPYFVGARASHEHLCEADRAIWGS